MEDAKLTPTVFHVNSWESVVKAAETAIVVEDAQVSNIQKLFWKIGDVVKGFEDPVLEEEYRGLAEIASEGYRNIFRAWETLQKMAEDIAKAETESQAEADR